MSAIKRVLKSGLLKETALYGITGVISKFAPLLIIPIYVGAIGVEGFGVLDLYITIGLAIFIICEAQAVSGVMRSYYECKDAGTLDDLIGSAVKIYAVTYIALLILFALLWMAPADAVNIRLDFILPMVIVIFPRQIFSLHMIVLRMEHKPIAYIVYNLVSVALTALLGVAFLYMLSSDALSVLYGISTAQLLMGLMSFIYIFKMMSMKTSPGNIKDIVHYGVPIAISSLAGWLLASSGRIVIADKASEFDLGVYSLSLKIAMVFMVLLQAFRTAWDPYCMKKFGEKDSQTVFVKSLTVYWIFGSLVVLAVYLMAPFFIFLLGAQPEILNQNLVLLILLGFLWQGAINIIAVGNAWARKTYVNSFGTIVGGLVSLVCTYLVVSDFGVVAGGLGYLLGMIVTFTIIYLLAQRNHYIPYKTSISVLFFMLTMGLTFYIVSPLPSLNVGA